MLWTSNKKAFLRCLDGKDPRKIIYTGDSAVNDIAPAKKIGMNTFGYCIDRVKFKDQIYVPDMYINDLREIITVV